MSCGSLLLEHVTQSSKLLASQNICIGLSGGIDSIVLLHILKHITPQINLSAVHINHNISANAKMWSKFCQEFCYSLNIPLHVENVNFNRHGGESLENLARIARYKVLLQAPADIIALAHHQDDQVETTLSQLLRGSDLHNIAGMHMVSNKQDKILWRPLLDISKAQIEEYAVLFGLKYINDESNLDTRFLRNFIRHDVLPLLTSWDKHVAT
ncbi:MAG: tilS, partial [Burkholderiales bacterium]|nr:tilS [Burkholderiales bacterium]